MPDHHPIAAAHIKPYSSDIRFHSRTTRHVTLKMTGQGRRIQTPPRPTTPHDPILASHPVPQRRDFQIRSFGPGTAIAKASSDADPMQRRHDFLDEIDRAADANPPDGLRITNSSRDLLDVIAECEAVDDRDDRTDTTCDLTWGFHVFLTDYSQLTEELLPRAMENLARVQQRNPRPGGDPPDVYAQELARRFRVDLVHDQEALQGASFDRVRENFRALVRKLDLSDDDEEPFPPHPRYSICFALDRSQIEGLANLAFSGDTIEDGKRFLKCKLPAVDIAWDRPEATTSSYCGVKDISVNLLKRAYLLLSDGCTTLEEFTE